MVAQDEEDPPPPPTPAPPDVVDPPLVEVSRTGGGWVEYQRISTVAPEAATVMQDRSEVEMLAPKTSSETTLAGEGVIYSSTFRSNSANGAVFIDNHQVHSDDSTDGNLEGRLASPLASSQTLIYI